MMMNLIKKLPTLILGVGLLTSGIAMEKQANGVLDRISYFSDRGNELRLLSKKFARAILLRGEILTLPTGFGSNESDLTSAIPCPLGVICLNLTNLKETHFQTLGLEDVSTPVCENIQSFFTQSKDSLKYIVVNKGTTLRPDLGKMIIEMDLPEFGVTPLKLRQKALFRLFKTSKEQMTRAFRGDLLNKFLIEYDNLIQIEPQFIQDLLYCDHKEHLRLGNVLVDMCKGKNKVKEMVLLKLCRPLKIMFEATIDESVEILPAWACLEQLEENTFSEMFRLIKRFVPHYTAEDYLREESISIDTEYQDKKFPLIKFPTYYLGECRSEPRAKFAIEGLEKKVTLSKSQIFFHAFIKPLGQIEPSRQLQTLKRVMTVLTPSHLVEVHPYTPKTSLSDYVCYWNSPIVKGVTKLIMAMNQSLDELSEEEFKEWRLKTCIEGYNPIAEGVDFNFDLNEKN